MNLDSVLPKSTILKDFYRRDAMDRALVFDRNPFKEGIT